MIQILVKMWISPTKVPALTKLDFPKTFTVYLDLSQVAIGTIFTHAHNAHTIVYASKVLTHMGNGGNVQSNRII